MEYRPMDVAWLAETARRFAVEYAETHFLSIDSAGDVQVNEYGLLELAPVEDWVWERRGNDEFPHRAYVTVNDVKFFTILTDEEREGALDGTLFQESDK